MKGKNHKEHKEFFVVKNMNLHRTFALILLIGLIAVTVVAQSEKYDVRQVKIYLFDKDNRNWNDASAFLGVRLDPAKKDTLEDLEISAGAISYSVGEEYRRYSLKLDASGAAVADVPFVVYKTSDKTI